MRTLNDPRLSKDAPQNTAERPEIFAQSWGVPLKPVIELWQHGHLEMVEQDGGVGMAMAFPGDDKAPLLPLSLGDRAEGVSRGGE